MDYFLSIDPSVEHPPLPLHEFLPLQPCLSPAVFLSDFADLPAPSSPAGCAIAVPAISPVSAAPITNARIDRVISHLLVFFPERRSGWMPHHLRFRRFVVTRPSETQTGRKLQKY